jgi:hypothetical protein
MVRHEILGHLTTLEQVTRVVHEGYLSPLLYQQAVHAAQRLLALVETTAGDEETRITREIVGLFQPSPFGLVQALYLSELIAAFYRELAHPTARQTPTRGGAAMAG